MNKKLNYEAPEMEVVKVRMEGGIMSLSATGESIQASKIIEEEEW